ncbi:DUF1800 family protein [Bordetella petrii]|nr:DUF1800 family protein [Bordetella petrii]
MLRSIYVLLRVSVAMTFIAACPVVAWSATVSDEAWLARVAYSAQPELLQRLREIGRKAFLEEQLTPPESDDLPSPVQAYLQTLPTLQVDPQQGLLAARKQALQIAKHRNDGTGAELKSQFAKTKQQGTREAGERSVLRAVYSPWQLREQLSWFWFNHFNVFHAKANVPFVLADYEDTIRRHALGNFRDLLEATLKHPAMIIYLDNGRSTKEKPNENYARELMELHTLGVKGGYTQEDVQALARILTGVSVADRPVYRKKWPRKIAALYRAKNGFQFDPRRHDFSDKKFLGHTIVGSGWPEVEQVLDILTSQPATARHIANELATYFVADAPSKALVDGATEKFMQTKGDIKATVRYLLQSEEFSQNAGKQFKSPLQYSVSAVQIAGMGDPGRVARVIRHSLAIAGQPMYGRLTPDGYELKGASWISTGQLANRLAIAENVVGLRPGRARKPQAMAGDGQARTLRADMQDSAQQQKPNQSTATPKQEQLFLRIAGPAFMYR